MAPVLPMAPAADAQNLYMQSTKRAMLRMAPTPPSPRTYRGGLPLCRVSGGAPTEPSVSVSSHLYTKSNHSYRSRMQLACHSIRFRSGRRLVSSNFPHVATSCLAWQHVHAPGRISDNDRTASCRHSPFWQTLKTALWQTTAGSHCCRRPFDSTPNASFAGCLFPLSSDFVGGDHIRTHLPRLPVLQHF